MELSSLAAPALGRLLAQKHRIESREVEKTNMSSDLPTLIVCGCASLAVFVVARVGDIRATPPPAQSAEDAARKSTDPPSRGQEKLGYIRHKTDAKPNLEPATRIVEMAEALEAKGIESSSHCSSNPGHAPATPRRFPMHTE